MSGTVTRGMGAAVVWEDAASLVKINRVSIPWGGHKPGKSQVFFKVREKSGNYIFGQGNSKFLLKVRGKSGNFIIRLTQAFILF